MLVMITASLLWMISEIFQHWQLIILSCLERDQKTNFQHILYLNSLLMTSISWKKHTTDVWDVKYNIAYHMVQVLGRQLELIHDRGRT